MNDEKIILKSLYPLPDAEFEFFHERVSQLHTGPHFKKHGFTQILKIFKLIYDFWLVAAEFEAYSAETCLQKALAEFAHVQAKREKKELAPALVLDTRGEVKIEYEWETKTTVQLVQQHHYFADTFKLKEFLLYRYMFNFPLHGSFVRQLREFFLRPVPAIDIKNYFELFVDSVKTSQMVEIWLRNVSVGSATNVMKLLNGCLNDQK